MSDDRAEKQAESQLECIIEMVRALKEESYAEDFAENLSRAEIMLMLSEQDTEQEYISKADAEEMDDDDLRSKAAELLEYGNLTHPDYDFDEDGARDRIYEDPISVEYRSGWSSSKEELEADEFAILLCTGGPACRITGGLNSYGGPVNPTIQYQDWYTPWKDMRGLQTHEEEALQRYCDHLIFS